MQVKDQEIQGLRKQTQILTEAYKGMEERRESKDQEILDLKEQMKKLVRLCKRTQELSSEQNNTIGDANAKFDKLMGEYNNLKGLLGKSMSMTKFAFERIEELERDMRGGLLIKLGMGHETSEELQRRAKILLQRMVS